MIKLTCKRFRYNRDELEWNTFLFLAKNSTFLFNRSFMDYHKDRFDDFSLLIYNDKKQLIACFPANLKNETEVVSHQGLTYGGIILEKEAKLLTVLAIFKSILMFYNNLGIVNLIIKQIPRFYNSIGADEVDYALFQLKAKLIRRDTAIAITQTKLKIQNRRTRSIKKGIKNGVKVKLSNNIEEFYNKILAPNLKKRFGISPVHSLDELELLASKFPNNIVLYNAYIQDEIMAGCILFVTDEVAHSQYISASDEGRKNGSLDYLFKELIDNFFSHKPIFDFGICNEKEGKELNYGLLEWKEGFGGRSFSHDFYQVLTKNYFKLDISNSN
jgi:Acetyltransferase (GNAT) domain